MIITLSLWDRRWREVQLSFFIVYIDDSGTAPAQKVVTATALIVPAKKIRAMESDTKQQRVFRRILQIIKKYGVKVFCFAMGKAEYEAVIPAELRKYSGKHHYTWALRHVLTWLEKWRNSNQLQPFQFVFDLQSPRDECRREIENVLIYAEREASEKGVHGLFTNYDFRLRKDLTGLQCVDLLAWMSYRYALYGYHKTPISPFAKSAWQYLVPKGQDGGPDDWLTALVLKKGHVEDWVRRELASGESMKRFQRWEAEDAAQIGTTKFPPKKVGA